MAKPYSKRVLFLDENSAGFAKNPRLDLPHIAISGDRVDCHFVEQWYVCTWKEDVKTDDEMKEVEEEDMQEEQVKPSEVKEEISEILSGKAVEEEAKVNSETVVVTIGSKPENKMEIHLTHEEKNDLTALLAQLAEKNNKPDEEEPKVMMKDQPMKKKRGRPVSSTLKLKMPI